MNVEEIRDYCLAKAGYTEGFPFGQDVLVFKVMIKVFALAGLECDPERAMKLNEL
jgi:predicted DNA-binding protein (MmcQ/YjbR family)